MKHPKNKLLYFILTSISISLPLLTKYFYDEIDYNLKRLDRIDVEIGKIQSGFIPKDKLLKAFEDIAVLKNNQCFLLKDELNEPR